MTNNSNNSTSTSTSTSASTVKDIFDAAISMPEGSKIPLSFGSESQRESFRVRFYNEKQRYAESFGVAQADTIVCSKYTNPETNEYSLIIAKTRPMSAPCIITPDGNIIPITPSQRNIFAPSPVPPSCANTLSTKTEPIDFGSGPETPEQRRQRLMSVISNVELPDHDSDSYENEE